MRRIVGSLDLKGRDWSLARQFVNHVWSGEYDRIFGLALAAMVISAVLSPADLKTVSFGVVYKPARCTPT